MTWRRRDWLATAAALPLSACKLAPAVVRGRWVGASAERGHPLLRDNRSGSLPSASVTQRCDTLVVGGGVAGLSALHHAIGAGVSDAVLLELEDSVGGNSRGHQVGGLRCPLGAHYLPVPGPAAWELAAWLHDVGLLRSDAAGVHADERHLCHSPQERLFIDGAWQEGLLPAAEHRPQTLQQYARFSHKVSELQRSLGFAVPSNRAAWTPEHAALDGQTFAAWLSAAELFDERLLAHLDYVCRDDYGAGLTTVSAWAGVHYFASRHGFQMPGGAPGERDGVFTWPEGNASLIAQLATPMRQQVHGGRTVLQVRENKHEVHVLAWNHAQQRAEAWTAQTVVMATPLFVSRRVLQASDATLQAALVDAARSTRYAPWLVANLLLSEPLIERVGAPLSWDNVRFAPAGSTTSLGYVNARHQQTSADANQRSPQLLTAYHALAETDRHRLLTGSAEAWTSYVLADLAALHPDLPAKVVQADLMRWGHAMCIPAPGVRSQPARQALLSTHGRIRFAHSDLAGYSVFEEAFTLGARAVNPRQR